MKRSWLLWLLMAAFIWLAIAHLTQIEKLIETFLQGKWQWVVMAICLEMIYFVVFTASYQLAFFTVGIKSRLFNLVPVVLGSMFINVVIPSVGTGGTALFIDEAARRGEPPARTATGTLLQLLADYSAFAVILVVGMVYLFTRHDLQGYESITALILLAMILGLSAVIILGLWFPDRLKGLLVWFERTANHFSQIIRHKSLLVEGWAENNVVELIAASQAVGQYPWRLAGTFAMAFLAHLLDMACLFSLFMAFYKPVGLGVLVAGYAIGILFWIVSITPQGIGIVEGVMAIVLISLGVTPEAATTVSLAFRGLTFWLPLLVGFILIRRVKTFTVSERARTEGWSVRVVALLTALMGLVNLFSTVTPSLATRLAILELYSPLIVRRGSHLTSALAGFALLLLAGGLWRRKRLAWLLTMIVLTISAATHLLKGLDYEEALLALLLVVWLWFLRNEFHARSDPPSVRQGLLVLVASLGFTMLYGTLGFYLLDRHYSVTFGVLAALRQTVIMFTQFYNPGLEPITGFGRYFASSIYAVGLFTAGYAGWMLIRPVLLRQPATPEERKRASQIVQAYGRSSLARLALMDDKAYFFTPGGSCLPFTVRRGVAITLGDPIGPEEDFNQAVTGFKDFSIHNDWIPAFVQVLPDHLSDYQSQGFETLCVGHEAIVDLKNFSMEGKASKGLRNAHNRLVKLGYRVDIYDPPISDSMLAQLRAISDEWLTLVHGSEKRFSLGWFDDDYIRGCPIATVISPQGLVTAFANIVPEYQRNETTIDLMRHRRNAEPGTMDFLFVSLFQWAISAGYETFNLGLSPLSGVGEQPEDATIARVMHYVYEHINQFYNFKGLHDYKNKFHPDWSPRYLIYTNIASLLLVWIATVQADSGNGIFNWWHPKPKTSPAT